MTMKDDLVLRAFLNLKLDEVQAPKLPVTHITDPNEALWARISMWGARQWLDGLKESVIDEPEPKENNVPNPQIVRGDDVALAPPKIKATWQRPKRESDDDPFKLPTIEEILGPIKLTEDQQKAWSAIQKWLASNDSYFVLRGFAGTGKTTLMSLLNSVGTHIFRFTAPTNKAAKVLSAVMKNEPKTIHSLLGIKMVGREGKQELAYPDGVPKMSANTVIVIDEAGMCDSQLVDFIDNVVQINGIKVMYVGDPAQLPPVGESSSPAWKAAGETEHKVMLREVKRFDNELLALSVRLRANLKNKDYKSPVIDDHADTGVFLVSEKRFMRELLKNAAPEKFKTTKVICWRNKTVAAYTGAIRHAMGFTSSYVVGDSLLLAGPITDDEGRLVGTIDEEGSVQSVEETTVKVEDTDIPIYQIVLDRVNDAALTLNVPQGTGIKLQELKSRLASEANKHKAGVDRKLAWQKFWRVSNQFHAVRYAYALTAHRAQGSTYHTTFVDQNDILANPNKREAFRCLYVAFTRATTNVYTF